MFKVVRILLSLIGLNLCVSTEATATQDDIPSIATMSFPSLIEFLTHPQTKTLPLNYLTAATKRLYEIHYFDHRIPLEHRSAAKPVLDTIIGTVKSALKGNPEGLQAYEKANRFMEEKVLSSDTDPLHGSLRRNRFRVNMSSRTSFNPRMKT